MAESVVGNGALVYEGEDGGKSGGISNDIRVMYYGPYEQVESNIYWRDESGMGYSAFKINATGSLPWA